MELAQPICRRARMARDARFDGKFFIGVRTTGIFCRPVCPAPAPKERNVEYFPSAAAAAEAGYRPCLRCRPECSPGTPAWIGSSVTVSRALRQIAEGALDGAGIEQLADRLGIGARHLRRLFLEHLGAPPVAVAQTQRLLAAKRLIDETGLPLTTIAMAAGYGSIRRFNAAFLRTYGRSPRQLRGAAHRKAAAGRYRFQLRYRPPFDWESLLAFLGPRATPGVEIVEGSAYRRSIRLDGECGWFEVQPAGAAALSVCIEFPNPARLLHIVSRVRRIFDVDADPLVIDEHLARDPLLAPLVAAHRGLRVPGAWDGFELAVRAVLGQQVSVAAATTLAGRLAASLGPAAPAGSPGLTHIFPTPDEVLALDSGRVGLPAKRAGTIRALAAAARSDDAEWIGRVRELAGIGEWTAQYVALRALGEPDAFPAGDLVLLRAAGVKSPAELEKRAEPWRPWRAYAALHLWQGVKDGTIDLVHLDGKPRRKAAAGRG